MNLLAEGLLMCVFLTLFCVFGKRNGAVQLVYLYEKEVQERAVAQGLITPERIRRNALRFRCGGMVWLSIYKAAEGAMDEATFADMVSTSMDSPLIRAAFKMKKKTAFTLKAQQFRKETAERTNPLCRDNPFHWNAEVILGRDADEYRINYRQCGLCALGKQEGLLHLVKHMCVLDTMSIDWMGGVLRRTQTLAGGGDCCDFYICKKDSQWDREAGA